MTGWLKSDGTFIECPSYEHVKVLLALPEVQSIEKVKKLLNELENLEKMCLADQEMGEHPEWHRYEILQDESYHEIYKKILDIGFIRICERGDTIYFEGRSNHLKNRYQKCKDFADSYGAYCLFSKI